MAGRTLTVDMEDDDLIPAWRTVIELAESGESAWDYPRAEYGPHSFLRDLTFTLHEAARLYQADGSHWIGEWHTHVDVPPRPSDLDLHTYAKHIADRDLGFDRSLALIIAVSESQPILTAWILERHGNELILMQAGTQPLDLS